MVEQLIVTLVGLGILGGAYLIDLIIGIVKVMFTPDLKWSWSKMLQDLVKALVLGIGVLGFVFVLHALIWYGTQVGADLEFLSGISFSGMIAVILGGCTWYLTGAFQNITKLIKHNTNVKIDEGKADYGEVVNVTKNIIDGILGNEKASEKEAEPTELEIEQVKVGQGGVVDPLARILPDGDNDNGRGWQCSKYSYYLATGIRMNYAPHPDYGPCNGNEMVDYLVNKYGWVRCGKERGAVFSVMTGKFGHTGVVLDPATNKINNANWSPLRVSTNQPYNDLNLATTKFCKPAGYNPTPAPTPTPQPTPPAPAPTVPNNPSGDIKVGDTVIAWGVGTGDSYGGGARTYSFPEQQMKVIGINQGRYALNQYNKGTPGVVADVTGWWSPDQIRKA